MSNTIIKQDFHVCIFIISVLVLCLEIQHKISNSYVSYHSAPFWCFVCKYGMEFLILMLSNTVLRFGALFANTAWNF